MNYPMLYWFIPRELVGFAKFLLIAMVVVGAIWLLRSFFSAAADPRAKRTRLIVVLLFALPAVGLLVSNDVMEKRHAAERKAYVQAAYAHFKQRCESAHITYYKQVPPQDGVFIMKPGTKATSEQLKDQFWMGDPYDLPDTPENEARGLLYRKKSIPVGSPYSERGGFDFVEMKHPELEGKFLRFTPKWKKERNVDGFPIWDWVESTKNPEIVSDRQARYGYTWDDISTPEDRKYWVAGGRLRVVDLETGEVVAERVGYVIERYFGATSSTFNQTPWSNSRGHEGATCPELKTKRIFLSTSLGTWNELTKDETK